MSRPRRFVSPTTTASRLNLLLDPFSLQSYGYQHIFSRRCRRIFSVHLHFCNGNNSNEIFRVSCRETSISNNNNNNNNSRRLRFRLRHTNKFTGMGASAFRSLWALSEELLPSARWQSISSKRY